MMKFANLLTSLIFKKKKKKAGNLSLLYLTLQETQRMEVALLERLGPLNCYTEILCLLAMCKNKVVSIVLSS